MVTGVQTCVLPISHRLRRSEICSYTTNSEAKVRASSYSKRYTYLIIFVALIVFLAVRPNGLMGKAVS